MIFRYAHIKQPVKQFPAENICNDYQMGRCNRSNCRFKHVAKDQDPTKDVCKDFQLGRCTRDKCRCRNVTDFTCFTLFIANARKK